MSDCVVPIQTPRFGISHDAFHIYVFSRLMTKSKSMAIASCCSTLLIASGDPGPIAGILLQIWTRGAELLAGLKIARCCPAQGEPGIQMTGAHPIFDLKNH